MIWRDMRQASEASGDLVWYVGADAIWLPDSENIFDGIQITVVVAMENSLQKSNSYNMGICSKY